MRHVTREEMQEIDRRAIEERKIPVDTLMAAAGKAVADLIEERISRDCPIVAVCGKGNNGGDGFVTARLLAERDFEVEVISIERSFDGSTAAGRAWRLAQESDVHFVGRFKTRPMTCIIDAIFGTGLSRPPSGFERQLILDMNKFDKRWSPVVAVDIPLRPGRQHRASAGGGRGGDGDGDDGPSEGGLQGAGGQKARRRSDRGRHRLPGRPTPLSPRKKHRLFSFFPHRTVDFNHLICIFQNNKLTHA